jgi:hypothetical protein
MPHPTHQITVIPTTSTIQFVQYKSAVEGSVRSAKRHARKS